MKHLNQYIIEKFKISKDIQIQEKDDIIDLCINCIENKFKYKVTKDFQVIKGKTNIIISFELNPDIEVNILKQIAKQVHIELTNNHYKLRNAGVLAACANNNGNFYEILFNLDK